MDLNLIPTGLIVVMYVFVFSIAAFAVLMMFWVSTYRNRKIVRNSSPSFMVQIAIGCTIQVFAVVALAQQDSDRSVEAVPPEELNIPSASLDAACIAAPALFSIGFFMAFSALFLKAWRLIRIFNNTKLRHLYVKDAQLFAYQTLVMVLVIALNLAWIYSGHLIWVRSMNELNEKLGLVSRSSGLCVSPTGISAAIPLMLGIVLMLIVGNYLAYLGRHIPTEFNESRWTAMAMVVNLEAFALGVPTLVLSNDNPVAGYVLFVYLFNK